MFLNSSISKKQTVAITGLLLILFVIVHLAGNLLIYSGPKAYNGYAHALHKWGTFLLLARIGLGVVFLVHIFVVYILIIENIRARGGLGRYAVDQAVGRRSLAEKVMAWSGVYLFVFIIFHILDFAAADQHGTRSYLYGKSFGLYGLVFNSFADPIHALLYVVAMYFLGMHLSHGVQSVVQTCGFRPKWVWLIKKTSDYFAIFMVLGFSSIPIYVYLVTH